MSYMGFTQQQKQDALATIRNEGLYTVISEKDAAGMAQLGLKEQVRDYATAIKEGGVSTFEVTARYHDWEAAVRAIPEGIIRGLGTQANILTLFRAIRSGVMVNVAAKDMSPLKCRRVVVPEQREIAQEFEAYMTEHYERIAAALGMKSYEIDRIREDAFTIDPIDFGKAHNAIVIPAGYTMSELCGIIERGGFDGQKAFNFEDRTPKMWGKLLAAVPDVYKKHFYICATGGRNLENLEETLKVPYVNQAGMSSLKANRAEESKDLAIKMREIVDRVLKEKKVKK